jgi:5'-nucleotidase
VRDTDSFTMAVNNYRQTGGGGFSMLAVRPVVHDEGLEIRQLLIDEVKARGTLHPSATSPATGGSSRPERSRPGSPRCAAMRPGGPQGPRPARPPAAPRRRRRTPRRCASGRTGAPLPSRPRPVRRRAGGPSTLRILAINDVHGAVEPRADARGVRRGGLGPLAAVIARARAECRPPQCVSLLLDGGDEFQGTPASNLTYGRAVVPIMRELGVVASALGNHEFDWGVDTLRARMRELSYPVLGANVRTTDGRKLPWLRDDTLVVRGGLRIGIVGVADPATPRTTKALNVKGLRFDPPAPAIDERARALRARGADLVIVTGHIGGYCDRDGENDPGAGAAAATAAAAAPAGAEPAVHGRGVRDGARDPRADRRHRERPLPLAPGDRRERHPDRAGALQRPRARRHRPAARRWGAARRGARGARRLVGTIPPRVGALTARALSDVQARVAQVVGEVADAMPKQPDEQYAVGNLIADAQRWATRADVAIMNNGGIRAGLPAGTATFGRLYEIQPFGNTLYTLTVRGSTLKAYLPRLVTRERPRWHVSGLQLVYDTTRTGSERLVSATFTGGAAIEDEKLYSVTINDFLVTGGDGLTLAEGAASVVATNVVDLEALIGYMRQLPQPVRAPAEVRIRSVTEPAP